MNSDEIDALADRIARAAAGIDAATHELLTDVRRFDEQGGWAVQGATSCAEWLSWKCGIVPGTAREQVRIARALGDLPLIDDELRRGQLSYTKVRALTRIATAENEATLVDIARASTGSQLEKVCRLVDQVQPRDPAADEQRRWLRSRDVSGGMVRIEAQLRPEEAARVIAACDVFAGSAAERADALLSMADATLRGDKPERPPVEVVVHIDANTLKGSVNGAGVSADVSRRLLCDAGIVPVLEDTEGRILDMGHKSRVFCGALRRALFVRAEGRCQFPGCTHTRYLHAHHKRHWIDGGATDLSNGCLLCTRHHAMVHEGGFVIVDDGDKLRFLRPDGRDVRESRFIRPCPAPVEASPPPCWDGEPVDYDAVLGCLT